MFLFRSSDVEFSVVIKEAKDALLVGDIETAKEKLNKAIGLKTSPSLKNFVSIQEVVVRFPKEEMEEFYKENKKFFSQSQKLLDAPVEVDFEHITKRRQSLAFTGHPQDQTSDKFKDY